MKVVISIDSFKGSLSSNRAADAVEQGILNVFKNAEVVKVPIADGGEGTVDALCDNRICVNVHGPLNDIITAEYGITNDGVAVIEMAAASGLPLVPIDKRNPMYTTTYGVGELILDAINRGCRRFIIGIGGSATNDGGTGMLSALGFEFLDEFGKPISLGAIGLKDLCSIDISKALPVLSECSFEIACDVKNPMCGQNGCSYVFAAQKGANFYEIEQMDIWLENYSKKVQSIFEHSTPDFEGAGAAGGLGFAFSSFLKAKLNPGIEIVMKLVKLEEKINGADFVVTGEGKLDGQSIMGKTPIGVAALAKKHNIPVIAFCGCLGDNANLCNEYGIDAYFSILKEITTLESALKSECAFDNLKNTVEQIFRLIKTIKNV